jgi:dipeptidyl aminopeptidase/acylaminoacyl peptidase
VPHPAANRLLAVLALLSGLLLGYPACRDVLAVSGKPFTIEAMLRVAMVDDVRVAADGRRAAFVVTRATLSAGSGELISRIHLADLAKGGSQAVTPATAVCDKPRFSPDGSKLAYLVQGENVTDIHLLQTATGQSRRLTDGRRDVLDLGFSPDGKWLAVIATAPGRAEARQDGCDADVEVLDSPGGLAGLYLLSLTTPAVLRPLVTDRDVAAFAFSPDGRYIVFETSNPQAPPRGRRNVLENGEPGPVDAVNADLAVVAIEGGAVRLLAATDNSENMPCLSPDGRLVAYVATSAPGFYYRAARVMVVPLAGGQPRALAETPNARPELLGWSEDGQSLFVRETEGVGAALYAVGLDGTSLRRFGDGPRLPTQASLSPGGRHFGLVLTDYDQPPEAFVSPAGQYAPKVVSAVNRDCAAYRTVRPETVRWRSGDGTMIEGLYTPPATPAAGPPPLLVELHGGPAQASQRLYPGMINSYPLAVFTERGYALFQPNVRGSDGYGASFRQALVKDWGGVDYADLMSGIDALVARGLADPARLGVMGWSYGGYLAAWAIGHTDRFAAASIGGGITNLTSLCGSMDLPDFIPLYFGGEAYERFEFLFDRSPLKYAAAIHTPTLFQHGVADERVPFTQALELYTALSRRGVLTRLTAYPRSGHDISEPGLLRDLMSRNLDWFTRLVPVAKHPDPSGPASVTSDDSPRRLGSRPQACQ